MTNNIIRIELTYIGGTKQTLVEQLEKMIEETTIPAFSQTVPLRSDIDQEVICTLLELERAGELTQKNFNWRCKQAGKDAWKKSQLYQNLRSVDKKTIRAISKHIEFDVGEEGDAATELDALVVDHNYSIFLPAQADLLGIEYDTLKRWTQRGELVEGIHWETRAIKNDADKEYRGKVLTATGKEEARRLAEYPQRREAVISIVQSHRKSNRSTSLRWIRRMNAKGLTDDEIADECRPLEICSMCGSQFNRPGLLSLDQWEDALDTQVKPTGRYIAVMDAWYCIVCSGLVAAYAKRQGVFLSAWTKRDRGRADDDAYLDYIDIQPEWRELLRGKRQREKE